MPRPQEPRLRRHFSNGAGSEKPKGSAITRAARAKIVRLLLDDVVASQWEAISAARPGKTLSNICGQVLTWLDDAAEEAFADPISSFSGAESQHLLLQRSRLPLYEGGPVK